MYAQINSITAFRSERRVQLSVKQNQEKKVEEAKAKKMKQLQVQLSNRLQECDSDDDLVAPKANKTNIGRSHTIIVNPAAKYLNSQTFRYKSPGPGALPVLRETTQQQNSRSRFQSNIRQRHDRFSRVTSKAKVSTFEPANRFDPPRPSLQNSPKPTPRVMNQIPSNRNLSWRYSKNMTIPLYMRSNLSGEYDVIAD